MSLQWLSNLFHEANEAFDQSKEGASTGHANDIFTQYTSLM